MINIKRVYESPEKNDGYRVLVDRMWPRGISKKEAKFDAWVKDVAPSTKLIAWYHSHPERWLDFKKRYYAEIQVKKEELLRLKRISKKKRVTFLYSTNRETQTNAHALKEFLNRIR